MGEDTRHLRRLGMRSVALDSGGSEVSALATKAKASQTQRYVYPVKFLASALLQPPHPLATWATFSSLLSTWRLFGWFFW